MKLVTTGARIFKENNIYKVEYQNKIIYENKIKDLALMLGLDKNKCEELLTAKSNCV